MAVYASSADLSAYLSETGAVTMPAVAEAVESLVLRAEREVDRAAGPWPRYSDGRRFSPPLLTGPQQVALARATCAAAEWMMSLDPEEIVGQSDFLPSTLTLVSRAGRTSPRMLEEMSGFGLINRTMTVAPDTVIVVAR